jgi:hypothetical protein
MGKDNNNSKPLKSNHSGKKSSSGNQSQGPKLNCILQAKDPKPNNKTIKAKFTKSEGAKVSEQICRRKTGNIEANLAGLMNQMVSLGDIMLRIVSGKDGMSRWG